MSVSFNGRCLTEITTANALYNRDKIWNRESHLGCNCADIRNILGSKSSHFIGARYSISCNDTKQELMISKDTNSARIGSDIQSESQIRFLILLNSIPKFSWDGKSLHLHLLPTPLSTQAISNCSILDNSLRLQLYYCRTCCYHLLLQSHRSLLGFVTCCPSNNQMRQSPS